MNKTEKVKYVSRLKYFGMTRFGPLFVVVRSLRCGWFAYDRGQEKWSKGEGSVVHEPEV